MFPNRRATDKMGRSSPSIDTRSEFGMAASSSLAMAYPAAPVYVLSSQNSAHMVPSYRTTKYTPMSHRSKSAIKWLRRIQLLLRILELNGAVGLLVLMILVINVDLLQGWIIRISVRGCRRLPSRYLRANENARPASPP